MYTLLQLRILEFSCCPRTALDLLDFRPIWELLMCLAPKSLTFSGYIHLWEMENFGSQYHTRSQFLHQRNMLCLKKRERLQPTMIIANNYVEGSLILHLFPLQTSHQSKIVLILVIKKIVVEKEFFTSLKSIKTFYKPLD